ncbi:TPA: Tn3 family transposase, partial [Klebsiella pneumoniae]|nr:Tn3 family transposase [Klebsiella pneumoniae]HBS2470535.1 Tn3 family transposase [Klebsiella pneumoniae]HBS2498245.1 Tn3 family transposase [Klebsiella pneumoniae]HBS2526386.1 Tn3 family transposase [Klebsiella pneumoniae]
MAEFSGVPAYPPNTVYLERAANALRGHGQTVDDGLLQYLSPLGWEHINLTGD